MINKNIIKKNINMPLYRLPQLFIFKSKSHLINTAIKYNSVSIIQFITKYLIVRIILFKFKQPLVYLSLNNMAVGDGIFLLAL